MNAGWLYLALAIASELVGTGSLRWTNDGPWWAWVLVGIAYGCAFLMLALALRSIDLGIAYALWAGIGTVGAALIGVAIFGERLSTVAVAGIALIIVGAVVVNLGINHA